MANANQMDVLRPFANAHTCISKPSTSQPQADHKPLAASIKTNVDHHQRNKPNQAALIDGARMLCWASRCAKRTSGARVMTCSRSPNRSVAGSLARSLARAFHQGACNHMTICIRYLRFATHAQANSVSPCWTQAQLTMPTLSSHAYVCI